MRRVSLLFIMLVFMAGLCRMRKESRSALLASKKAIDENKLSNREELLRSSAVREKQDLNEKVTYVIPQAPHATFFSYMMAVKMHSWMLAIMLRRPYSGQ